mmetsp:Transcript_31899/g.101563  ORF Transcript_31899/g.101563 Transcript_31899/m.101563 type:complete len:322 (-) Transcript_31899:16-981(-)
MPDAINNKGKDLVISYSVKMEDRVDCGGSYIKLLPDMDQDSFGGDTTYGIMFGPDVCGTTRRTHVIFNYPPKDDNLLIKENVKVETDALAHLYTLHVKPDNTFEVFIDKESVKSGTLKDNWDFLEPEEIEDPNESKPEDWVDERKIPDPEDVKPEGYDDIPAEIPDPEAEKPDDWDDDEDGEWEPPMVDNPEYNGPWKAKMIDNPDYKGPWVHPMVPNPDFEDDPSMYHRCDPCTHVGFELWQVKTGVLFDDIIVTDSLDEAWAFADKTWAAKADGEKAMHDEIKQKEEDEKMAERKAKAEAAATEDTDDYADEDIGSDEL